MLKFSISSGEKYSKSYDENIIILYEITKMCFLKITKSCFSQNSHCVFHRFDKKCNHHVSFFNTTYSFFLSHQNEIMICFFYKGIKTYHGNIMIFQKKTKTICFLGIIIFMFFSNKRYFFFFRIRS